MKELFVILLACFAIALFILPMTTAHRKKALSQFMGEDKRAHTPKNLIIMRGRGRIDETGKSDAIGPRYEKGSLKPETTEDLAELIDDYANMMREYIILMDNTETRTQKRGNVKTFNHAFPDGPCSCEYSKELIYLGSNYYPQYLESRNCSTNSCPSPYRCKEEHYYITVLKLRSYVDEESQMDMPEELGDRWVAKQINVTMGCSCARVGDVN